MYKALDVPGYNDKGETTDVKTMESRLARLVAPKVISLKVCLLTSDSMNTTQIIIQVGAQVMLIKVSVYNSLNRVFNLCPYRTSNKVYWSMALLGKLSASVLQKKRSKRI